MINIAVHSPRTNTVMLKDRTVIEGTVRIEGERVAVTTEKNERPLAAARHKHGDGFRLRESRQIVEVAVLAVSIVNVPVSDPLGRRGKECDAVRRHLRHEMVSTSLRIPSEGPGAMWTTWQKEHS